MSERVGDAQQPGVLMRAAGCSGARFMRIIIGDASDDDALTLVTDVWPCASLVKPEVLPRATIANRVMEWRPA